MSAEDVKIKFRSLRLHAELVERKVPLMMLQTTDVVQQLKFFAKTYYKPVLTQFELL